MSSVASAEELVLQVTEHSLGAGVVQGVALTRDALGKVVLRQRVAVGRPGEPGALQQVGQLVAAP